MSLPKRNYGELPKKQKKEERTRQREAQMAQTMAMLESRRFVLEANYLSDSRGNRVVVSSNINFIRVDSAHAVIQIGNTYGIGYNGVGGITADGEIRKYDLQPLRNNSGFNLTLLVSTNIGAYDIFLSITPDGFASATLSGNWGGRLTWDGVLVPLAQSRVYKGMSY